MSILGDIAQAVPLDRTPLHYRFPARLAQLENIRTGIDAYMTVLDQAEPVPVQQLWTRSILEEEPVRETQWEASEHDLEPVDSEKAVESETDYVNISVTPVPTAEKEWAKQRKRGKKGPRRRRIVPKQQPTRDFIRENILNLKTVRKEPSPLGQLGEDWVGRLLQSAQGKEKQSAEPEKPLVLKGILKARTPPPTVTTVEAIRSRMESAKVVRNPGLLSALFDKVADTFALNWEAAADSLISDLLGEEAEFLTSLETAPPEPAPIELNVTDLLAMVKQYGKEEETMRRKYCVE